jgi:aryl-alcohol dehydrogenase-like predicted oxidoreductase
MQRLTRVLGRSELKVSALGLGTMGIGGLSIIKEVAADRPIGYGQVDDAESVRAIHRALDLGITLFDTADVYGCGHSERVLARGLKGRRDEVVLMTKFGHVFDETNQVSEGEDASPAYVRWACEGSLRRLETDRIDVYLFHLKNYDLERAPEVLETLESLVAEGKIRYYGWSTDDVARARLFAQGEHCTAIEHRLNYILDAPELLALCETENLASINRIPFLMGILTGKYRDGIHLPADDMRNLFFGHPAVHEDVARVEALRPLLTAGGRTLAQASLAWNWARSPRAIPVPGFKTVRHVEDSAAAMTFGPLTETQMAEVAAILGTLPSGDSGGPKR